jgi:hypothetical protein
VPFKTLTFMGDEGFFLLFLPLIYWCVDRRTGARLTLLFLLSAYINTVAKLLADQPRPFAYDPRVRPLVKADGGGLPSGHTQHAVVVWGYLALKFQRFWPWVIAALLMILIPLSRLYLGVHFPTDLLGGYFLGGVILFLYLRLKPGIEAWIANQRMVWQMALALALPGVLMLLIPSGDKQGISAAATLMGMSAGFVAEHHWIGFESDGIWWKRLLRFLLGVAVSLALWLGLKAAFSSFDPEPLFRFIRYALLGLWAALGAPWVFKILGLVNVRHAVAES